MKSLFIVGAGRNGTSLTTGLFRNSPIFMGDQLHPASLENPTGYFESALVNQLNNRILGRYNPERLSIRGLNYSCDSPGEGNGWLSRIPIGTNIQATDDEKETIRRLTANQPFCLKDTRFSYLLHLWKCEVPESRTICVFRPPEVAASSLLKSCRMRPALWNMAISVNQAFEIWILMYSHILEKQAKLGEWFFVRYENILSGKALAPLSQFTGLEPDSSFTNSQLNRSTAEFERPKVASLLFEELCERADLSLKNFS